MIDKIRELENIARLLEPDAISRDQLLRSVSDYTHKYLEAVPHARANMIAPDRDNGRALLDSPITEEGIAIEEVLNLLDQNVDSLGVNLTSGRHLGYIPGGGLFHAALGDYLAAITNRYAGMFSISPGAVRIENMLLSWMGSEIGYHPKTLAGNLTSGGSLATLTAIVTARQACGISQKAYPEVAYYVTEHVHHCVDKALRIAGLDWCLKRKVKVDPNYRMDPEALKEAIIQDQEDGVKPWLVVASAGTVTTGAVDPLSDIGKIASEYNLWFHVDGAYGGLFALCPEGKDALHGIELSDSVVLDPHKALFLPYGTGAILVREGQKLYDACHVEASYLNRDEGDEIDPIDLSVELTKHFRGLRLWLPLKLLGVAPFRAALSEKIWLARYFYEQVKSMPGFAVGPAPDLSLVSYRYLPQRGDANEFNERLKQSINKDGRIFISSAEVDSKRVLLLRAAILSYRTHLEEIVEAIKILEQKARQLEQDSLFEQ